MYPAITRCYYDEFVFCVNRTKGQWNVKRNLQEVQTSNSGFSFFFLLKKFLAWIRATIPARAPPRPAKWARVPFYGALHRFFVPLSLRFYDCPHLSPRAYEFVFSKMRIEPYPSIINGFEIGPMSARFF
jgi:hypothetical protein